MAGGKPDKQGKADQAGAAGADGAPPKPAGKKKLLLVLAPVALLALGGAGAVFAGLLPLGAKQAAGPEAEAPPQQAAQRQPVLVAVPEIVANLNAPGRRAAFVRVRSQVEVAGPQDAAALQAAMPRVLDLFATYLREMRPEELRGSAGTHRLREELIARANLALAPARVTDVLFTEIIVQ